MPSCGTVSLAVIGASMLFASSHKKIPSAASRPLIAGIAITLLTLAALSMAGDICATRHGATYTAKEMADDRAELATLAAAIKVANKGDNLKLTKELRRRQRDLRLKLKKK